jgi:hypothetical protein
MEQTLVRLLAMLKTQTDYLTSQIDCNQEMLGIDLKEMKPSWTQIKKKLRPAKKR